jgi:hypothetical protein
MDDSTRIHECRDQTNERALLAGDAEDELHAARMDEEAPVTSGMPQERLVRLAEKQVIWLLLLKEKQKFIELK